MDEDEYNWDVFVSHNHKQKPWVRSAVEQWRALGLQVFFDDDSIQPGDELLSSIEKGLEESRYIVFVITPASVASKWVALEIACTISTDPDASLRRVIPVILESTPQKKIRLSVRRLKRIDLRNPDTRRERYHDLLRCLDIETEPLPEPPDWQTSDSEDGVDPPLPKGPAQKGTAVKTGIDQSAIELTINRDIDSFTEEEQEKLLRAIQKILEVSRDIRIINKRRGSVVLTLEVSPQEAERLFWAVKADALSEFGVTDAEICQISFAKWKQMLRKASRGRLPRKAKRKASASSDTVGGIQITQEEIAERAFEKFSARGFVHGFDIQDWFDAEEELIAEYRDRQ